MKPEEIADKYIYQIDNGKWNNSKLISLLNKILNEEYAFHRRVMEYEFATGKKNICISGRRSYQGEAGEMIMLTIETENCKQEGE